MDIPHGYELYQEFENEITKVNRFFQNEKFERLFLKIITEESMKFTFQEGKEFYRARIRKSNHDFTKKSDLGMNKVNPSNNRASPRGIPCMYLADEPETAIAELRANVGDTVTVATFKASKDLNFLTLKAESSIGGKIDEEFSSLDVSGFVLYLSYAFSRPIQSNAEIEYLPSQFFTAYCKKNGFDGIRYVSCARGFHGFPKENHFNYVLFDDNHVTFKSAFNYEVEDICYAFQKKEVVNLQ